MGVFLKSSGTALPPHRSHTVRPPKATSPLFAARVRFGQSDDMPLPPPVPPRTDSFDRIVTADGIRLNTLSGTRKDYRGQDFSYKSLIAENPILDLDFEGATLIQSIFRGIKFIRPRFTDAKATRAIFNAAELPDANFSGAQLDYGKFIATILTNAVFRDADIRHGRFYGAILNGADFSSSDPGRRRTNLSHAILNAATLVETNLQDADLRFAQLNDDVLMMKTRLDRADLSDAEFCDALAIGASFEDAIMKRTNLSHTQLIGACLNRVKLDEALILHTDFSEADLIGADLRKARIHWPPEYHNEIDFDGANLSYARLDGLDLTQCQFRNTNLTAANLQNANLSGMKLEEGILFKDTRLAGANLEGVKLHKKTVLDGVVLQEGEQIANLNAADLRGVTFKNVDLNSVTLTHARLQGADLYDTHFFPLAELKGAMFDKNTRFPPGITQDDALKLGMIEDTSLIDKIKKRFPGK